MNKIKHAKKGEGVMPQPGPRTFHLCILYLFLSCLMFGHCFSSSVRLLLHIWETETCLQHLWILKICPFVLTDCGSCCATQHRRCCGDPPSSSRVQVVTHCLCILSCVAALILFPVRRIQLALAAPRHKKMIFKKWIVHLSNFLFCLML